jgi:hypothetical protein
MYKEIYNAALPDSKLLSTNLNMAGNAWGTGRFLMTTIDSKTYFWSHKNAQASFTFYQKTYMTL